MEDSVKQDFIQEEDAKAPHRLFLPFITGWILYLLFIVLDVVDAPLSLPKLLFIRLGVVTPSVWIMLFLSRLEIIRRHIQPYLYLCALMAGGGILAMIFVVQQEELAFYFYYAGLFLIILWTYALAPLRFPYAAAASWTVVLLYNGIAIFGQELLAHEAASVPVRVFINNNFFLISSNIIGMVAGHSLEQYKLKEFQQRKELAEAREELFRRAHYDDLTGLPNRSLFFDQARPLIALGERSGNPVFLLYLDLDRFKSINDTLGHDAGDKVLRRTGKILQRTLRDTDIPCRMGGDEFLVLLSQCGGIEEALTAAERVLEAFRREAVLDEGTPFPTPSIGLARARSGEPLENLIARSDHLLYSAKQQGRNKIIPEAEEIHHYLC